MKKLTTLLAVAALAVGMSANAENLQLGAGSGILIASGDGGCGSIFLQNTDMAYDNGYAINGGGIAAPDYGAFAECFAGNYNVCSVVLDAARLSSSPVGQTADFIVWDDNGGIPGSVIGITPGANPGPVAVWPSVSRHIIPVSVDCTPDNFWAGYWGNWIGATAGWFVAADFDLFGCPVVNWAPGSVNSSGAAIPTGWGPTGFEPNFAGGTSLGIGVEANECGATPTHDTTWGAIKGLYN
jgi:hypothetical protein